MSNPASHFPLSGATPEVTQIAAAAERAFAAGQITQAEQLGQRVLALDPHHGPVKVILGYIAAGSGNSITALHYLREAVNSDRSLCGPRIALAYLLRTDGRSEEAIVYLYDAIRLGPDDPDPQFQLGLCYLDLDRPADAASQFSRACILEPENASYHIQLGAAFERLGRVRKAVDEYRSALSLQPRDRQLREQLTDLASLVVRETQTGEVPLDEPQTADGCFWLGKLLDEEGDLDGAELLLRKSIALDPSAAEFQAHLGFMLQQAGRFDEGGSFLKEAIRLQPDWPQLYSLYMAGKRISHADDGLIAKIESLLSGDIPTEHRAKLHGSLGKAYDNLGDYETAIHHFDTAHALMKANMPSFDRDAYLSGVDRVIETFSVEFFSSIRPYSSESELPLLIVGMIRSGTTLTEQILSSHPKIASAGELYFWFNRWVEFRTMGGRYIAPETVKGWSGDYLKLLRSIGGAAERVTDKQPENYFALGLILGAFANARVVHCRRFPMDTCVSIYTTPNVVGPEWSHDRDDIVFAYRQYLRIMEHWRSLLPPERLIEIDYEATVQDPEPVTRRLVEFCGLDWDDACLRHEVNAGAIRTPSLWQARQPVYSSSKGRWRNYERWLGSLADLLN